MDLKLPTTKKIKGTMDAHPEPTFPQQPPTYRLRTDPSVLRISTLLEPKTATERTTRTQR